jgi:hypothetical protein
MLAYLRITTIALLAAETALIIARRSAATLPIGRRNICDSSSVPCSKGARHLLRCLRPSSRGSMTRGRLVQGIGTPVGTRGRSRFEKTASGSPTIWATSWDRIQTPRCRLSGPARPGARYDYRGARACGQGRGAQYASDGQGVSWRKASPRGSSRGQQDHRTRRGAVSQSIVIDLRSILQNNNTNGLTRAIGRCF